MTKTRLLSVILSVCMVLVCMAGMCITAGAVSLEDCTVTVNTDSETVTVTYGDEEVPESEYELLFFSYTSFDGGEQLIRVGEEFPTADGTYVAAVTANEDSDYNGETRSEPFIIGTGVAVSSSLFDAEVIVDAEKKTVTVMLNGEVVPASEYHIIFFTYEKIPGGESLDRAGTDFPTAAGTYIATVTANEGSEFTDSARSEPFTLTGDVSAATGAAGNNPRTGVSLAGTGVLILAGAALLTAGKKRR